MINTQNLSFQYDNEELMSFPDVNCDAGEMMLVLGQSGVGKTTLLHLLSGIIRAKGGSVSIAGQNLSELSDKKLDHFRGQYIGVIFQKFHFIKSLNVLENLTIAQKLAGKPIDKNRCKELLENLQIGNKINSKINELSQGEIQRVAIARALVNNHVVILADEPTSALDDSNCQAVLDLLSTQAKQSGAALVIVTHDTRLKDMIDNKITIS